MSKTQEQDFDDDGLDYIGRSDARGDERSANEVIRTGEEPHHRPSRPRRTRDTRFDQNRKLTMPSRKSVSARREKSDESDRRSRRKSETPKASASVKSSKKAKDNQRKERNKTLTQMDFVQRWVKLESDDDSALDYMYYTPKEDRRKSHGPDYKEEIYDGGGSSGSKRRKLDEHPDSKDTKVLEKVPLEQKPSQDPVTPQKPRKLEIPSSQSPASPGFAIISPSQFRSAGRSPLKRMSANVPCGVQQESPGSQGKRASQISPASFAGSTMSTMSRSPMIPSPQAIPPPALNEDSASNDASTPKPQTELFIPGSGTGTSDNPRTNSSKRERTVVYETDAETDSGDFQDDSSSVPPTPTKRVVDRHDLAMEGNQDSQNHDDSSHLPRPPEPDSQSGTRYSQLPMSSNASVCYRRIDKPTQHPVEPIPTLNTQKMIELFPQGNTQLPGIAPASETQSYPSTKSQTSHDHRGQAPTQDLDNMSTEIVPESSPVTRQDDEPALDNPGTDQLRHKSVVQVESSQPADRFNRCMNGEESGPRGVLSRSDLLSSSVMESIPMPQFMMGSQDSVGEPYSLPDDKDG